MTYEHLTDEARQSNNDGYLENEIKLFLDAKNNVFKATQIWLQYATRLVVE